MNKMNENRYFYFFIRVIQGKEALELPMTAGFTGTHHPSVYTIHDAAKKTFALKDDAQVFIMFMYEFNNQADFESFTKKPAILLPNKPSLLS